MAGEARRNQFSLEPLELGIGGFLGAFQSRRVADHVSGQDRRQSPLFRAVFETSDRFNERVASSFNTCYIAVAELAILERFADGGHVNPEAALLYGNVRPDRIDELLLSDDLAWTFGEIEQNIERPAAKGKRDTVTPQHPLATQKLKRTKSQRSMNTTARHSLLMLHMATMASLDRRTR